MHILMIANDSSFIYNLRREILQRMVDTGHKVSIMCQIQNFQKELQNMGCNIINIDTPRQGKNPFKDLSLFFKYFIQLKAIQPDVVFTNNIKPNVYGGLSCRLLKLRYIANITGLGTPLEISGLLQKLAIRLYKLGIWGASCIFFQNKENQHFFETHRMISPKSKKRLLPGSGVNLVDYPALPYPKGDTVHFQYTSRILKEKGIDIYLFAAKAVHDKYSNTVFHICGGCDDKRYLKILQTAQEDGYIIYHGEQNDMVPYLQQAGCIVHPSYYPEGMSNVLLEGAASARPIIATDRSGCRETVEDGVTGFLIPMQNVEALIDALERVLAMRPEERQKMGHAGRIKMEREFDRELVVTAYIDVLKNEGYWH